MASRKRPSLRVGAVLCVAVLAVAAMTVMATSAPPAAAQGFGWFGGLLGGGTPQRSPSQPAYPGYRSGGDIFGGGGYERSPQGEEPRRRVQRRKRPVEPAQDVAAKKPPKANATIFVDVFGDGFGLLLAGGLDEALADRQEVAIVRKARGSSGLANTAFYDWPKSIDEMLKAEKKATPEKSTEKDKAVDRKDGKTDQAKTDQAKANQAKDKAKSESARGSRPDEKAREKIDVAVMMVGSNDRQPITVDGKTWQRGSDEWNAVYRKRVTAIAEAFQRRKVPLIWVGLPIMKDDEFADDMAALNEIYKDAAAKTGATYVDSWEVFSDEKGEFAALGPDINGQTQRLRTPDGIFFTHAGARKLAHFVETHLRRDIDGKIPPPQLPTAEAPETGGKSADKKAGEKDKPGEKKAPSVALAKPEAGPIKNLGEAPSAKGGALVQLPGKAPDEASIVTAGRSEAVPSNRADNFRWPAEPPRGAGSPKPAAPDRR